MTSVSSGGGTTLGISSFWIGFGGSLASSGMCITGFGATPKSALWEDEAGMDLRLGDGLSGWVGCFLGVAGAGTAFGSFVNV